MLRTALVMAMVWLGAAAAGGAHAAAAAGREASDGQWTMPSKDYAATRYSELKDITPQNAHSLHPVWTFSTGVLGGHEGQPLVVGGTMYVVTPWPNVLYAFDLTREDYPLRWKYRPDISANAIGVACCDTVNRGAFYVDGRIVYNLLDGHTVAVDARTGRELWRVRIADLGSGETVTMAPIVVRDRVIVGASGGEFGIYGWLKGLDLNTAQVVWTAHNMGPDADMLIRPGTFKAPYDSGADLGAHSWAGDSWRTGGAPVWGSISYDPELDLLYYATGAMILADLTIAGHPVKALVHFDKNGFAYTLDRTNGRLLVAAAFAPVTWARAVDLQSGRPLLDAAKATGSSRGNVKGICPSAEGGVSPSSPPAYSPRTHLFYSSTNNLCMDYEAWRASHLAGTPFMGVNTPYSAGPGSRLGGFIAWDAASGRKVWENPERYPNWSGALATAGDVVFYGTLDGWFKSVDARSGKVLSKFKVGSGVVGNPITYRAPDGRQYVAVYAGIGGDWALLAGDTRSDDPTDVRAPADYIKDIARHTSQGGIIWIFGL